VLQGVMFDQLCRDLMDALLVGFSVVEVIWTVRDNLVVPKRFAKRPSGAFRFVDLDDQQPPALRMVTAQDMLKGVELPDRKFLVHRVNPDDDNPYGTGLGSQLYWPVLFKRKGSSPGTSSMTASARRRPGASIRRVPPRRRRTRSSPHSRRSAMTVWS
jgi:phage gp29-like protein